MYDDIIQAAAGRYNVPADWIKGYIQVESSGDPTAYNPNDPGGAWGLMQIIASTARAYGVSDLSTLFNPVVNIDVGAHLLHDLIVRYGRNLESVASAYNSGNPTAWETNPDVAEYVRRIKAAIGAGLVEGGAAVVVGVMVWLFLQFRKRGV